jgi:hypothetical protein
MRAVRGLVGREVVVKPPELENRFEASVRLRLDMVFVEACDGGWRFGWEYTLDDVIVNVLGEDRMLKQVPYASVSHWEHASAHAAHVMADPASTSPDVPGADNAKLTVSRADIVGSVTTAASVSYTGKVSFQDVKVFLMTALAADYSSLDPHGLPASAATTIGQITVVTQDQC